MPVRPHIAILGADMIHAHPTLAEGFMEAAEAAEDKAIHHVKKQVG
jgi:hypothetical protein